MDVPWRKKNSIQIQNHNKASKRNHNITKQRKKTMILISSPRNIKTKSQYTRTISGFMIDQTSKQFEYTKERTLLVLGIRNSIIRFQVSKLNLNTEERSLVHGFIKTPDQSETNGDKTTTLLELPSWIIKSIRMQKSESSSKTKSQFRITISCSQIHRNSKSVEYETETRTTRTTRTQSFLDKKRNQYKEIRMKLQNETLIQQMQNVSAKLL